jgi:hypothetical protein
MFQVVKNDLARTRVVARKADGQRIPACSPIPVLDRAPRVFPLIGEQRGVTIGAAEILAAIDESKRGRLPG